jgi:hypothetical protein
MLLVFRPVPVDLSFKLTCLVGCTTTFWRAWFALWAWADPTKLKDELRKAQPEKRITPLAKRETRDTFLFTSQLSNNMRENPNKYVVLQQIE